MNHGVLKVIIAQGILGHAGEHVVEDVEVALIGPEVNHPGLLQQVVVDAGCNTSNDMCMFFRVIFSSR